MSKNYGNDSQMSEIVKYISDNMKIPVLGAGGGFAPLGMYGFSCDYVLTPPQGWLFADGSIYNIADYPEYAALLASQHGRTNIYGGDGVTTFATKDLRGEFIRGWGQNSHANQGSGGAVGEHQDGTEFFSYCMGGTKENVFVGYVDSSNEGRSWINNSLKEDKIISTSTKSKLVTTTGYTTNTSNSGRYTSRPTNTSVAFLVKVTLSDAEINAFNVYTPREHQVAWWEEEIDGVLKRKPVYSRLFVFGRTKTLTDNNWNNRILGTTGIDIKRSQTYIMVGSDEARFLAEGYYRSPNEYTTIANSVNDLDIRPNMNAGTVYLYSCYIEYTKTTDDWQTS